MSYQDDGDRPPDRRRAKNKTVGHYILGHSIGEGERGKVRLGTHVLTGERVAVKVLEKDHLSSADVARTAGEVFFMKLLSHPHVLRLYEVLETSRKMYLVSEFAAGGELFEFVISRGQLEEDEARRLFHQLLSGVEAIHGTSVAHRGLQGQSVLLDERGDVKITDFGFSRTYVGGQLLSTACGSPYYAAPEMLAREEYDPLLCDLWSCGVILYMMVCGRLPFEDPSVAIMYQKIRSAECNMPTDLSEDLRSLLGGILSADPAQRPTIAAIREHPWYQKGPEAALAQSDELEEELLEELNRLGFQHDYVAKCLLNKKHNHVTATYHLLRQKFYRQAHAPSPAPTDSADDAGELPVALMGRQRSSTSWSGDGEHTSEGRDESVFPDQQRAKDGPFAAACVTPHTSTSSDPQIFVIGLSQPARAMRSVIRRGDSLEPPEQ